MHYLFSHLSLAKQITTMKKSIYLILFAIVLLSSCKQLKELRSEYTPENNVPGNLIGKVPDNLKLDSSASSLGDLSWRNLFKDPRLEVLVDEALANNTDIRVSRLRVEEMEISLSTAKKAFLPSLSFNPQGAITSFDGVQSKTYSLPLTAQWQADIFGSLKNKKRAAEVLKAQSQDVVQATQCQLVANVANLYYQLMMLDEEVRVLTETEKIRKESITTQQALMEAGMVTSAAVDQMKASYYSVQAQKIDAETQIIQIENAMCILLARTPQHIARGRISDFQFPTSVGLGVPANILSNRPDVRVAERNIEAAFYLTNEAKAALYPQLTLGGTIGWTNNSGTIVDPGRLLWNAVASLTQPIYAQGKIRANIKLSEKQMEEAKLNFVQSVLSAGKEVNDALTLFNSARQKEDIIQAQVKSLDSAYYATKELMLHGQGTYLEVLMAQESLLSSQMGLIANEFSGIQSLISLYVALGGGR